MKSLDSPILPEDTAVAVVFFRPSPAQVERIIERFGGRMPVLVYDNGGIPAEALARLRATGGLTLLGEGRNRGIAAALNALARAAAAAGSSRLFLLDQDADATVETAQALGRALDRLAGADRPPALVGPVPAANPGHKAPRYPVRPGVARQAGFEPGEFLPVELLPVELLPVEFLATSGSLVDLAAFARIGPFREDFFIDAVDLEWCFRAWDRGWSCWMDRATAIPHSVGRGTIRARFLPVAMPDQPLFRMAVYVRNTAYGWRLPHVPGRWKRRQIAYLPLQIGLYWARHRFSPRVLARLVGALGQGLRGRLGRPADAPP